MFYLFTSASWCIWWCDIMRNRLTIVHEMQDLFPETRHLHHIGRTPPQALGSSGLALRCLDGPWRMGGSPFLTLTHLNFHLKKCEPYYFGIFWTCHVHLCGQWLLMALLICSDEILLFIFFRLNPPAPASICCCICFRVLHAHNKRPVTFSANSQLANLRRTNNFGQIRTDWLVQPRHCRCAADWLLSRRMRFSTFFRSFLPASAAGFSAQSRKATLLASFSIFHIFQHLSTMFAVSCILLRERTDQI